MEWKYPKLLLAIAVLLAGRGLAAPGSQQQAWTLLKSGANEKSFERRAAAVGALGLLRHDRMAAEIAETALDDARPEVRAAAARSLGEMGWRPAIPELRKALNDKEDSVVAAAGQSLVELKDSAGYELYYSVLTGERKSGQGFISKEMETLKDPKKLAMYSIEGGIGFIPFGGYGLSAVQFIRQEQHGEPLAKAIAAKYLAGDPDPQSKKALVEALSDKSWLVRESALESLAKRADRSVLPSVRDAMSDQNEHVQYTAAAAVVRLTDVQHSRKPKQ